MASEQRSGLPPSNLNSEEQSFLSNINLAEVYNKNFIAAQARGWSSENAHKIARGYQVVAERSLEVGKPIPEIPTPQIGSRDTNDETTVQATYPERFIIAGGAGAPPVPLHPPAHHRWRNRRVAAVVMAPLIVIAALAGVCVARDRLSTTPNTAPQPAVSGTVLKYTEPDGYVRQVSREVAGVDTHGNLSSVKGQWEAFWFTHIAKYKEVSGKEWTGPEILRTMAYGDDFNPNDKSAINGREWSQTPEYGEQRGKAHQQVYNKMLNGQNPFSLTNPGEINPQVRDQNLTLIERAKQKYISEHSQQPPLATITGINGDRFFVHSIYRGNTTTAEDYTQKLIQNCIQRWDPTTCEQQEYKVPKPIPYYFS